jgi:hypothetical protein
MKLKKTLYSVPELAGIFNVSVNNLYSKIRRKKIESLRKIKGTNFYDKAQFDIKKEIIIKYYPLKQIETYYIVESKMNQK